MLLSMLDDLPATSNKSLLACNSLQQFQAELVLSSARVPSYSLTRMPESIARQSYDDHRSCL